MFLVSSCSCLCPIHWSQVLNQEWRCNWSSTDRLCSSSIWVFNNFFGYHGAIHSRSLTVEYMVAPCWKKLHILLLRISNESVDKWMLIIIMFPHYWVGMTIKEYLILFNWKSLLHFEKSQTSILLYHNGNSIPPGVLCAWPTALLIL